MEKARIDDMLDRYGEICTQQTAAKILGVVPRTVARMMQEGRLRRIGHRVDVRSIAAYIEDPVQTNFVARVRKDSPSSRLSEGAFLAAAKTGKWAPPSPSPTTPRTSSPTTTSRAPGGTSRATGGTTVGPSRSSKGTFQAANRTPLTVK